MIKHLGSVVHIHSSGMVETDKGNKYPYSKAKIGDVMIKDGFTTRLVTKEEYKEMSKKPKQSNTEEEGDE